MSETFSYTPAVLARLAGEAKACVERGEPDLLAVMCHDLLPWAGTETAPAPCWGHESR